MQISRRDQTSRWGCRTSTSRASDRLRVCTTAMAISRRCMLQTRMHQPGQPLGYCQGTPCSRQTRFRSLRLTGFQLGSNLQPKRRHINSFQSSQFLSSVLGRAQPCSTKKAEKMFRTSIRSGFWEWVTQSIAEGAAIAGTFRSILLLQATWRRIKQSRAIGWASRQGFTWTVS